MAPSKAEKQPYEANERVLCFHHEVLYEAKVLDVRRAEDGVAWECKVHYKGWKQSWDEWVPTDRIRKFTEENQALAKNLQEQLKSAHAKVSKSVGTKGKKAANGSDFSSARGSEERGSIVAAQGGRGPRGSRRDYDLEQESDFNTRPKIKLPMPDNIKAMLVDDWENVTKFQQLVPLPATYTINRILSEYETLEMAKREANSPSASILEEMLQGLRDYFDRMLGRMLLYRFERPQYSDIRAHWTSKEGELAGKGPCDTYGAEHLCRLLVSLPELIAQTNMDQQSCKRLREELDKFATWLGGKENVKRFFTSAYEVPNAGYVDKARA